MILNITSVIPEIKIKIELLCYGVQRNDIVEEIYKIQNPYNQRRTGNIGIQLLIGQNKFPVNIPAFNRYTERSPYKIVREGSSYFVQIDNNVNLTPVFLIKTPIWYNEKVADDKMAANYLLQEGTSTLIASITETCNYAKRKNACAFCAITSDNYKPQKLRKQNLLNALKVALSNDEYFYQSINLTGGNNSTSNRGIESYKPYVEFIRTYSKIPICIELSPPSDLNTINELVHLGVTSFMMNIEIWDEKLRKVFMPAKSSISRFDYIKAWERAVELVGVGNVSSVIIIGLENEASVLNCVGEMINLGVIPSVMPLRPNDGTLLENFLITQPNLVFQLTIKIAKILKQHSIEIPVSSGCIGCGACAAENDVLRNIDKF